MSLSSLAHLVRRGEIFYFRRAIPKALMPVLGRRELKFSLGTDERSTARMRCRDMANAFERMLGEFQGMTTALTQAQIDGLLRTYFERKWEQAKQAVKDGRNDREFDRKHEAACAKEEADALRQQAADGQYDNAVRADARELLSERGIGPKSVDLERLDAICHGILRAQAEQRRIFAAMLEGRYADEVPCDPLFANILPSDQERTVSVGPANAGETLIKLFEEWKIDRKPSAKAAVEFSKGIRRFIELHGDVAAISINKPMVREFKAALQKVPAVLTGKERQLKLPDLLKVLEKEPAKKVLSAGSVNKDLRSLSAVLAWAGTQGYFDANPLWSNPVTGMTLDSRGESKEERICYSPADLKTIFTSPVFSQGKRPAGGGGEAAKWLPLLGLFTGARLEELGQALVSDIRKEDGVIFLAITREGGGKSLKTESSSRIIPLHPWLIRLGFLAYVEERRKSGDTNLFPDLKLDTRFGKRTGSWSQWWGRYVRRIGITDPRKVYHSFRHGFKAACRAAEIEEEIHDRLTGHAPANEGRKYGNYGPKVLDKAIRRVSFDVDLSHLLPNTHQG